MDYQSHGILVKSTFKSVKNGATYIVFECPECKKDFEKLKSLSDNLLLNKKNKNFYCSRTCALNHTKGKIHEKNKEFYDKKHGKRTCICGKECVFKGPSQGYTKYCSHQCHNLDRSTIVKRYSLERYGTENPFQSEEVKAKIKEKMIKKYGCDNPSKSEIVKELKKKKSLERYGTEYPSQSVEVRLKVKATNLELYGYENIMHHPQLSMLASLNGGGRATSKRYKTKFEDEITVQGKLEEKFVKKCEENDIVIQNGPFIYYELNRKRRKYFVDFKVKINNEWKLVEIKSKYWYDKMKEEVEAKKAAAEKWCVQNGFKEYILMIDEIYVPYENKGEK